MIVMLLGRLRGLPDSIDPSVCFHHAEADDPGYSLVGMPSLREGGDMGESDMDDDEDSGSDEVDYVSDVTDTDGEAGPGAPSDAMVTDDVACPGDAVERSAA